jgi:uncharacterized protein YecE (DUF72 family)
MIYIGTSGFQYDDWVGPYYPEGLPKENWLSFYAQEFNTLEINFTYYRMPTAKGLAGMARKVPDAFIFAVKATQEMTHARERDDKVFEQYRAALVPLQEQSKLGPILAQFPNSFRLSDESRDYLNYFRGQMDDLPVVIEFRNKEWIDEAHQEETFELLNANQFGFCCVDEPYFPRVAQVTSDVAYVRFHGRNYKKWWKHEHAWERYDYTYPVEELQEWAPKIEQMNEMAENTFVFSNNHYRAQGIDTARQMKLLLSGSA